MGKENIAIIIGVLREGGAERAASYLSLLLSDHYSVHLIVFDGRRRTYPVGGTLHDLGIPYSQHLIWKILRCTIAVRRLKRRLRIKASISFLDTPNIVNAFSRRGERVIASVRNHMSLSVNTKGWRGVFYRWFMRHLSRTATIVPVSNGVAQDLQLNFGVPLEKQKVIYNPCDKEWLNTLVKSRVGGDRTIEPMSVITMGRLVEQKAQWHLIRAFKAVTEAVPAAHLYLLGNGRLQPRLVQLVNELGLSERVHFWGYVEAPHIYIEKSRVFVLTSEFEGIANAIIEAMAYGVPVVTTDCHSGPREILAPGSTKPESLSEAEYAPYGVLTAVCGRGEFDSVTPLSEAEGQLVSALIALLTDDDLHAYYVKAGLTRAQEFSPQIALQHWLEVITGSETKESTGESP